VLGGQSAETPSQYSGRSQGPAEERQRKVEGSNILFVMQMLSPPKVGVGIMEKRKRRTEGRRKRSIFMSLKTLYSIQYSGIPELNLDSDKGQVSKLGLVERVIT